MALETLTTPGAAAARTLWANTLDRLEQELPRATFETWLRPTEGHSVQGNDLKVLVASPHNAEWLEQRLYQTILRALRQGSDQKLDVSASRWGRPIGRRRGPGSRRAPGLYQTPSTDRTWRLTRRELTPADPGGPATTAGCATAGISTCHPGNRLTLAAVLDLTVGAADRDLLDPGRGSGASPPALRPLRQPAGPSSNRAGKPNRPPSSSTPTLGCLCLCRPAQGRAGSGNTVPKTLD